MIRADASYHRGTMRASAQRVQAFRHIVKVRDHRMGVDEPGDKGGDDTGPSPQELLAASLASCTAVTMEMYADRKGWNIGDLEVVCEFPPGLNDDQVAKLKIIAAKCPVHRTLDGEVMFDERVERLALAPS